MTSEMAILLSKSHCFFDVYKRWRKKPKSMYLRPHVLVYMGGVKRFPGRNDEALVVPGVLAILQWAHSCSLKFIKGIPQVRIMGNL